MYENDIEQIMIILENYARQIMHMQDGIEKCFDRIELIERKLKENHIGE